MIAIVRGDNTSMRLARISRSRWRRKRGPWRTAMPHRPLSDQARSHAVQCSQVRLIVGLYWNAACRWPQHCFRNCACVAEVVLVTLPEWLGIGRRYLSHIVTECEQLAGNVVRRHTRLDPDQARRCIR
jgi:hypothetical protein